MIGWPVLSLTIFLPLFGAVFIFLIRGEESIVNRNTRFVALWTTLVTFFLSTVIWIRFDPEVSGFQLIETRVWFESLNISYRLGVDGISMPFILLTTLLMPLCVLASWTIKEQVKSYMIAFLILETMILGTFCALDLILFYVFFEGVLLPMFLIIGVWGGLDKVYAAFKFFLYTLFGSVLMLVAIITLLWIGQSSEIPFLLELTLDPGLQTWLWLGFFASFAVKLPMWPVHTWLPDAHVQAPTAGSVILAGVLLKMGGYGFLRFSLPLFPDASLFFTPLIYVLSVIAIVYTSLVALAQEDMKKLIAYSSVAHMGFVTLGLFTFTVQGIQGALFQMLSHGVVSAALFLCVGVLYDRTHSRQIADYGGVVSVMPRYAFVFMVMMLAAIGLPGTSGFVGEILILIATFQVNTLAAVLATFGIILSAAYMLWLYRRVVFGSILHEPIRRLKDLSLREIAIFSPLIIAVLWMGLFSSSLLDVSAVTVQRLIQPYAYHASP